VKSHRGFSLIEALIALALGGLVTAGVAMALRTGLDASARIRERADAHAEARAALDAIAGDLAAAYLSGVNTEETYFTAQPPELTPPGEPFLSFTTLSYRRNRGAAREAGELRTDAVQVEYALEPAPDGSDTRILARRERWLTETGPGEADVVCARVETLRLRFLGRSDFDEGWSAGAEENMPLSATPDEDPGPPPQRELPRAVEVTLLLAPAPGGAETEKPRVYRTVVPIRADGPPPFEVEIVPPPEPAGAEQRGGGNTPGGGDG
jgi:prepilin-type N-terminal cleavage/methylation domain-containing protein